MDPVPFGVLHPPVIFLHLLLFLRGWTQMRALGCCSSQCLQTQISSSVPCGMLKM